MTLTLWRHNRSGDVYIHDADAETLTGPLSQSEYMDIERGAMLPIGDITDTTLDSRTSEPGEFDADQFDLYRGPYYRSLYSTTEAAQMLGVDVSRVRRMAANRGLGQHVGRAWVFTVGDIDAMRDRPPGRRPAADS